MEKLDRRVAVPILFIALERCAPPCNCFSALLRHEDLWDRIRAEFGMRLLCGAERQRRRLTKVAELKGRETPS